MSDPTTEAKASLDSFIADEGEDRIVMEHNGWKFGDRVRITEDNEDRGLFEGSEGHLVISKVGSAEHNNERVALGFIEDGMESAVDVPDDSYLDWV